MHRNWDWWILSALLWFCFFHVGCDQSNKAVGRPSAGVQEGASAIRFGDKFYDVSVADKENTWVVGYHGAILHSNDGGKHWSKQNSGGTNSLLGVSFEREFNL